MELQVLQNLLDELIYCITFKCFLAGNELNGECHTSLVLRNLAAFIYIEELDILDDSTADNGWIRVKQGDTEAYVAVEFVDMEYDFDYAETKAEELARLEAEARAKDASNASLGSQVANYGLRFVGNPYVWGGTSLTRGADCSGFVMSVFANYGVYLPHSSRAQAYCGTRINSSQMKPGDLVFYGRYGIDHVAIYIGNGQIVHAANTRRGIVINSWNYMTPVRIVNVLGN